MINKLTPEQEVMVQEKIQEWIGYGLSCERADRPRAEAGLRKTYQSAGLTPPKFIFWVSSPYQGAYARAMIPVLFKALVLHSQLRSQLYSQLRSQLDSQLHSQLDSQLHSQLYSQLRSQLYSQLDSQLHSQLYSQLYSQLRSQLDSRLHSQLYSQLYSQLDSQLYSQLDSQLHSQLYSQLDSQLHSYYYGLVYTPQWYSAWADLATSIGVTNLGKLEGWQETAKSCGWFWVFEDFAIMCERPIHIKRDQLNNLHCADGSAVEYQDGYKHYSWHGTNVPADLIEGIGWTTDQILKENNAEIRRCAIERMGWHQFIKESGMKQVGKSVDDPGNPGQVLTLYDIPKIFTEPVKVLLCTNATVEKDGQRHQFGITTPSSMKNPIEAAAWTFGLSEEQYSALERAC